MCKGLTYFNRGEGKEDRQAVFQRIQLLKNGLSVRNPLIVSHSGKNGLKIPG